MELAFIEAGFKPLKPKKVREPKPQKCRKCGGQFVRVEGTNVMVCTGDIEIKNEAGEISTVPCNNKFIFST